MSEAWGPRARPERCCERDKRTAAEADRHDRRVTRELWPWLVALAFFLAWALGGP